MPLAPAHTARALETDKSSHQSREGIGRDPLAHGTARACSVRKEMHWLESVSGQWDRDDTEAYLESYTRNLTETQIDDLTEGRSFLLDATPAYLASYQAAPRAKQIMPHAKFVAVLRVRVCFTSLPSSPTAREPCRSFMPQKDRATHLSWVHDTTIVAVRHVPSYSKGI